MAKTRIETGRVERYRGDQLVVAMPHLDVVLGELGQLGARPAAETDAGLGLALLTLRSAAAVVRRLREDTEVGQTLVSFGSEFREKQGRDPSDLDLLLRGLRDRFARRYAHWAPTMGKNRVVEQVKGFPHLGGGGVGDPVESSGSQFDLSPEVSEAGRGVRVAMLDTPVMAHPQLLGRFVAPPGAFIRQPGAAATLKVTQGHGTFVAGLILRGAPGVELEVRKVLEDDATGDAWAAAKEMVRLAGYGVEILNLSCGLFTDDDEPPLVLSRAVEQLSPGVVIVAAAGNHGDVGQVRERPELQGLTHVTPMWPAALDDVVAVDAADDRGELATFSPRAPWVDLVAPGKEVESTYLDGNVTTERMAKDGTRAKSPLGRFHGFARWSGTSFAAAAVSGALAARTQPGHVSAREALQKLLQPSPAQSASGGTVRPFTPKDLEP